ncbi:MAG: peptide chain release factor N(5)-glutamine methyltransferase [Pseudobdellovibrionaceae bacterium]
MKISDILPKTTQFFKEKNLGSPRLDAEILISWALGWRRLELYLKHDYPLSNEELEKCRNVVRRRSSGEPVAYILGEKDFYGRTFKVGPQVLIPRPETEHLIETLNRWSGENNKRDFAAYDLGSGSGCIAHTVALEFSESTVVAVEKSVDAADIWKINKGNLESRAELQHDDVVDFLKNQNSMVDVILANPPYIAESDPKVCPSVRKFEPSIALFAEDDGKKCIFDWSRLAFEKLKPGGLIAFEIGADQGTAAKGHFESLGFDQVHVEKDLAGFDRIVRGIKTH